MKYRSLILIASLLAFGIATWLWYSKRSESQAQEAFAEAYVMFRDAQHAVFTGNKTSSKQMAMDVSVKAKYVAEIELGSVTSSAMALPPDVRRIALKWTEAQAKALRALSAQWRAMYDHSYAIEQNDFSQGTSEIDKARKLTEEADAEASHMFDQLVGVLPADVKKRMFRQ